MAAFVPGAGLPLSSSRIFVAGSSTIQIRERTLPDNAPPSREISAIKLPKFPDLPKLPELPNVSNPFAKQTPPPPKPGTTKAPAAKAPAAPTQLSVGGRSVKAVERVARATAESMLSDGIPKFYKPATARAEFRSTAKGQNETPFDIRMISGQPTAGNARVNEQGTFRNMDVYTDDIVWARPGWSSDEARVAINVAIRNIFGNANLFESELAELSSSISCVTENANMKEFVRAMGLSNGYRRRFFESTSNMRFVETNFKHFLGRAPRNQAEVSEHIRIINEEGYNAEINSYIDCDEYDTLWGESRVPAVNFRGGHPYNNDMNKLAVLSGGFGSSDRIAKKAYLVTGDATGFNAFSVQRGLPEAWRGENQAREEAGPVRAFSSDKFWNPQPLGLREAEVAWTGKYGNWNKFWYKDSAIFKEIMTPNMTNTQEEKEEAAAILKYGSTVAKNYTGCRKAFDVAPVIELQAPSTAEIANGTLSVAMKEISFAIPSDLQQKV